MIAALRASLEALLERMKHSLDEDESLLVAEHARPRLTAVHFFQFRAIFVAAKHQ